MTTALLDVALGSDEAEAVLGQRLPAAVVETLSDFGVISIGDLHQWLDACGFELDLGAILGMDREVLARVKEAITLRVPQELCQFEVTRYSMGARLDERHDVLTLRRSETDPETLPTKVDHTKAFAAIRHQGRRGTCVAFAFTSVHEFARSDGTALSEQFLYCLCKAEDGIPNQSGTYMRCAVNVLATKGQCRATTWPYNPEKTSSEGQAPPPQGAEAEAADHRIGFEPVPNAPLEAKAILAAGKGIAAGFQIFKSSFGPNTSRTGRVLLPLPGERPMGGHAMAVAGYRDDASYPGGGYFIVRNSWGTDWAAECPSGAGYCHIPYTYLEKYGRDLYATQTSGERRQLPVRDTEASQADTRRGTAGAAGAALRLGVDEQGKALSLDVAALRQHAIISGATGSGKTGLLIRIAEQLSLQDVPLLVLDPKGDLTNLALTFPDLEEDKVEAWVPEARGEDARKSASRLARAWSSEMDRGALRWEELAALQERPVRIITPASSAGEQVSMLGALAAPSESVRESREELSARASTTAASILTRASVKAEHGSPAHNLVAAVLMDDWVLGRDVTLAALVQRVRVPELTSLGALPLDDYIPERERDALARSLNGLLAAPDISAWIEGSALDFDRLMRSERGEAAPITIVTMAHLSDADRVFFVACFLQELVNWMRSKSGTGGLRLALLLDEARGFAPPVAKPPSKEPLLTLVQQGRAYGVGVILALQHPADLDYRIMSNARTWLIGRLRVRADMKRLREAVERSHLDAMEPRQVQAFMARIAELKSREFALLDAHAGGERIFTVHPTYAYLRGPLTKNEIRRLYRESPRLLCRSGGAVAAGAVAAGAQPCEEPAGPGHASPVAPEREALVRSPGERSIPALLGLLASALLMQASKSLRAGGRGALMLTRKGLRAGRQWALMLWQTWREKKAR